MMYLAVAIFALLIGSFLNTVIYRLPLMVAYESHKECALMLQTKLPQPLGINLFWPRSFCPTCKNQISAFSNIPLLSYMLQMGRCRACSSNISLQYPLVELLTMALSLLAAWKFGLTLPLLFSLIYIWILIPLFFIDVEHHLLPDSLTISLLWIGLIANAQGVFCNLSDAVFGAVAGYLILFIVVKLFFMITGKIGMGYGDLKLFSALGAWFGWLALPAMLLFSSIIGVIVGLFYLKATHKSKDTPIPFGPFLSFSGLLFLFYGNTFLGWYLG